MGTMSVGARPLVPSRLKPGGVSSGRTRRPTTKLAGYIALMKLRVVELLLITTLPAMVLAQDGWPSTRLVVVVLLGGTMAAGGANAINMYVDRDIDAQMRRTAGRPFVTGLIAPLHGLTFAIGLNVVAFFLLWWGANLLAACLTIAATLHYVFVYTLLLKRHTKHNIFIGGAAGAVPALVGWAAVRGSLAWEPWLLFIVILLWTPPHTWALAMRHRSEYSAVAVPMLPVVETPRVTVRWMMGYIVATVAVSLVLIPVAPMGWIYGIIAVIAGAGFLWSTIDLARDPGPARAMRVFSVSITYVTLVFGAVMLDVLVG